MILFLKKIRNFLKSYSVGNYLNIFKSKNLKKYWQLSNKKNHNDLMIKSMNIFLSSPDYAKTSKNHKYWLIKNLKNIENSNEKLDTELFQFDNPQFHSDFSDATISELTNNNNETDEPFTDLFKIQPNIKISKSFKMNFLNFLIYNKIKKSENFKNISHLKDVSFIGKDNIYNIQNKIKITQEKLKSLIEYETISKLINKNNSETKIVEIGSGNGRICDTVLSINPLVSKYVLADIPPALTLAYDRLKKSFPEKKIFYAIDIKENEIEKLNKIFNDNEIVLILPYLLNFLKQKFDLLLAIDCLHEMNKETIKQYMDYANNNAKKIYFKVHQHAHVPFSLNIMNVYKNEDYYINPRWKEILKKKSLFPSDDVECAYEIP